jgi:hypothetical protein
MRYEQSPEKRTLPLLRMGLLVLLSGVVSSLRQREVDRGDEGAIEEEGPLRKRCLEDGVEGPRVVLWRKD